MTSHSKESFVIGKPEEHDTVAFNIEQLEVWELAIEYMDTIYKIADQLPRSEEYNLKSHQTNQDI